MSYLVIGGIICTIPNCCGVQELGELVTYEAKDKEEAECVANQNYRVAGVIDLEQNTERDFHDFIDEVSSEDQGAFVQVWFADNGGNGIYFNGEFRDLFIKYGAGPCRELIHLGSAVNPNSGNTLDGYMWKTNQK